ncbi:MAG: regulatory protein LuxR [Marmoricola sp.]|jgi:DNA-binding NarL/FixJ family response regulator|nr:regulatory protein LuxR [Marmoricola sp.]
MSLPSHTPAGSPGPIRIAIMNDYELVVAGLQQMLAPYADRVQVVELDSGTALVSDVDVLLYDAFTREQVDGPVAEVLRSARAKVVLYTWHLDADLVREALAQGASGCVAKASPALDLVEILEKIAAGSVVVSPDPGPDATVVGGDWPGRDAGLTVRESEILALIAQGLSNQEVAQRAYLSINSVKTYIRTAYRKIGAESRTQAVLWATQHGFTPTTRRVFLEPPRATSAATT